MKMKIVLPILGSLALMYGGCATSGTTPSGATTRTDFTSWPAAVKEKVLAGEVAVGFTQPQVEAALGAPDYRGPTGARSGKGEVWGYRDSRPRSAYGFRPVFVSAQKSTTVPSAAANTPKFVIFFDRDGRVTAIENVWW